ncbi:MAG: UbiA family prenyltransferase [Thermoplasmata archaeon]
MCGEVLDWLRWRLRVSRPMNAFMGFIGVFTAALLYLKMTPDLDTYSFSLLFLNISFPVFGSLWVSPLVNILFAAAGVSLILAGGNALNDYLDSEIDKGAHPNRPIPAGMVSPEKVKSFSSCCFFSALALLTAASPFGAALGILAIVMLYIYEYRWKAQGAAGNLIISILTAMIFSTGVFISLSGWSYDFFIELFRDTGKWRDVDVLYVFRTSVFDFLLINTVIPASPFFSSVAREIVKDVEDMGYDFNRTTFPMVSGIKRSRIISAICIMFAVISSFFPYLPGIEIIKSKVSLGFIIIADVIFIYSIVLFLHTERRQFSRHLKLGMAAALIAYLLGGLV